MTLAPLTLHQHRTKTQIMDRNIAVTLIMLSVFAIVGLFEWLAFGPKITEESGDYTIELLNSSGKAKIINTETGDRWVCDVDEIAETILRDNE